MYDPSLVAALSEATHCVGELAGLAGQLPNPYLLIRPFIRQEAVSSSRIEGTQTDLADLYAFEAGQQSLPGFAEEVRHDDAWEVSNYVQALEEGLRRLPTLPVSVRLLRDLHRRLMTGVRGRHRAPGELRRIQNWIGGPDTSLEDATYVPPPAQEVDRLLSELELYIHAEDPDHPPLIRLAFIHYQFEAIHPFLDGNGRIGRLLLSLLVVSWKLLPHPLLYLSAWLERHRQRYYDLLLGVSREEAWRQWVLFFLRGVASQARQASQEVQRLQTLQVEWREVLTSPGASSLTPQLMESLFSNPVLTIPRAKEILGVSYPTAQNHVERLQEAGIVQQIEGVTHPKVYVARKILLAGPSGQKAPASSRTSEQR